MRQSEEIEGLTTELQNVKHQLRTAQVPFLSSLCFTIMHCLCAALMQSCPYTETHVYIFTGKPTLAKQEPSLLLVKFLQFAGQTTSA